MWSYVHLMASGGGTLFFKIVLPGKSTTVAGFIPTRVLALLYIFGYIKQKKKES